MEKGNIANYAEMETFSNVFQYSYSVVDNVLLKMKGHWHEQFFKNDNPVVLELELGCGKGEYVVCMARMFPNINFIGVDVKGTRMWIGIKVAMEEELPNVAFLRIIFGIINRFFIDGEVQEIWLRFSAQQLKNESKRLSFIYFMERYRKILVDGGLIHLKIDSISLFTYIKKMVKLNGLQVEMSTDDLYHADNIDEGTKSILYIRTYYESMWQERG